MSEPRIRVSALLRWQASILLCRHEKNGREHWLLAQALAHSTDGDPPELEPLADELEGEAHAVSAERARSRGGRF